jgi:hypothetical protein
MQLQAGCCQLHHSLPRYQEKKNRKDKIDCQELDALIPVGLSAAGDEGGDQDSHEDKGDLSTGKGEHKGLGRGKEAQQNEQRLPGN